MKRICLLGATGSIGESTLEVIRKNADELSLYAISFGHNLEKAIKIIEEFHPLVVATLDKDAALYLKDNYPYLAVYLGKAGIEEVAGIRFADDACELVVVNGIAGFAGVAASLAALSSGNKLYLANKETLLLGSLLPGFNDYLKNIIPLDSEHVSLLQLLDSNPKPNKLIITASGGALRDLSKEEIAKLPASSILDHPTWKMGQKVTIDSALMLNKAFEVIEAKILFGYEIADIIVKQERTSHIHAGLIYDDETLYLYSNPSMVDAISYGLLKHNQARIFKDKELSDRHLVLEELNKDKYPLFNFTLNYYQKDPRYLLIINAFDEALIPHLLKEKININEFVKVLMEKVEKFDLNTIPTCLTKEYLEIAQNTIKDLIDQKYQ